MVSHVSMSSDAILNAPVLVLNTHWQPVGETTVARALVDQNGGTYGRKPSKLAMHVELVEGPDGDWLLGSGTRPIDWEEWITLDIRDDHHEDRTLHTHRFAFRGPTVLICSSFDEMPVKRPRLSAGNIWERDQGTCQYTGKRLPRSQLNIDHVVPRDKGGRDEWTNMVLASKELNTMKGNRHNHEVGLKLIRQPKAPGAIPAAATIKVAKHVQWEPFLL